MKRQKANSLENITWSELGKQNIQAKKVYLEKTSSHDIYENYWLRMFVLTGFYHDLLPPRWKRFWMNQEYTSTKPLSSKNNKKIATLHVSQVPTTFKRILGSFPT